MSRSTYLACFAILIIVPRHTIGEFNPLCSEESVSIEYCYSAAGANVFEPKAYILKVVNFLPVCNITIVNELIPCYNDVIDNCSNYRDNGPDLMTKEAFLSFIAGMCLNEQAYRSGEKCLQGKESILLNIINRDCLTPDLFSTDVWSAYIQMGEWTWAKWCKLVVDGIECSIREARLLNCPNEFYDFLKYAAYTQLPVECYDNTNNFMWLTKYKEIPETFEIQSSGSLRQAVQTVMACVIWLIFGYLCQCGSIYF